MTPDPASCTRHPSLHFILRVPWDRRPPHPPPPLPGAAVSLPAPSLPSTRLWDSTRGRPRPLLRAPCPVRNGPPGSQPLGSRMLVELVGGGGTVQEGLPVHSRGGGGAGLELEPPWPPRPLLPAREQMLG